jgi:hypothetical protein
MDVSGSAATAEEIETLQRVIASRIALAKEAGRLPPYVRIDDRDFVFGEDTDGGPAVWISLWSRSDQRPSDDDVAHVADLIVDIITEVLKSGVRHWPHFRFHIDERSHGAA